MCGPGLISVQARHQQRTLITHTRASSLTSDLQVISLKDTLLDLLGILKAMLGVQSLERVLNDNSHLAAALLLE